MYSKFLVLQTEITVEVTVEVTANERRKMFTTVPGARNRRSRMVAINISIVACRSED